MRKLFFFFLLLSSIAINGYAQNQRLQTLETKKKNTKLEIERTNKLLKETSKSAQSSLQQLNLLNTEILLRNNLLQQIDGELSSLTEQVDINQYVVRSLTSDLEDINGSYAHMIRYARQNQNDNDQLYFILSSKDFNQAYERYIHLRQLTSYRRKQSEAIKAVRSILEKKVVQLEEQMNLKAELKGVKLKESMDLEDQKAKQDQYYNNLKQKEKELKRQLSQQRRIADNLNREIERVIAEEARKARAEGNGKKLSEADVKLNASFADNKGRLPWPVDNGIITDKFGEHNHPILKKVKIKNSGIDIATQQNENAKSVFKGEVSRVLVIPGANKAVIVRHGSYLTVYSNLEKVYVRTGEKIETNQVIGKVFTDKTENNTTTLKFQVWKESSKLNPELWLKKAY